MQDYCIINALHLPFSGNYFDYSVALTIDKTDCYTRRVMMCAVTSSTCVCFGVANFSFTMSSFTQPKAAE